jgi:ribose transport system permease protein
VWILLFVTAISAFVLRATPFGWHVYAVGGNLEAARRSGLGTRRTLFAAYAVSGLCAAISALIIVSRLTAGEPSQGTGMELDAIAIVVIGGTSLFGGIGGVGGTLVGAGIIAVMANLLNLLGVSPFSQQIVKGLIILAAVLVEGRTEKRRGT